MIWLWSFIAYSFSGFLLEMAFGLAVGGRQDRKGLWVLPLCPVYGVGACFIVLFTGQEAAYPPAVFVLGGLTATVVEYCAALYHERVLGVSFWSYEDLPGNIQGKICIPFSLAWGVLSLGLVYWLHPLLSPWLAMIPAPVGWTALAALAADGLLTAAALRRSGSTACLRWRGE